MCKRGFRFAKLVKFLFLIFISSGIFLSQDVRLNRPISLGSSLMLVFRGSVSFLIALVLAASTLVLVTTTTVAAAATGPQPLEECAGMTLTAEYMDYGNGVQDIAYDAKDYLGDTQAGSQLAYRARLASLAG